MHPVLSVSPPSPVAFIATLKFVALRYSAGIVISPSSSTLAPTESEAEISKLVAEINKLFLLAVRRIFAKTGSCAFALVKRSDVVSAFEKLS